MTVSRYEQVRTAAVGATFQRDIDAGIMAPSVVGEERTVELSFSSAAEVERPFGIEVLSHDRGACNLSRLTNGGALLVNHDVDDQVGVVESASIDGGFGIAKTRFGSSARADEIYTDVKDRIRTKTSVRYVVEDIELVADGERNGVPSYLVTRWTPLEVSIVSIPADNSTGLIERDIEGIRMKNVPGDGVAVGDSPQEEIAPVVAVDQNGDLARILEPAHEHADAISALARQFDGKIDNINELEGDAIELRLTVDEFRSVLRGAYKRQAPKPAPAQSAVMIRDVPAMRIEAPRAKLSPLMVEAWGEGRSSDAAEALYGFGQMVRAKAGRVDALRWMHDYGQRAMSSGNLGSGGALIPDQYGTSLIRLVEEYGIARQVTTMVPMASDTMQMPRRASGATAYFVGDNDSITESNPETDLVTLAVKNLAAYTKVPNAMLDVASVDLGAFVANEQALAIATKEDNALFNGDGTSTYGGIVGIRPKIIDGTHTVGAVDAASGNDTFAEIDKADVLGMMAVLPIYAANNASFYVSRPGKTLVFDSLITAVGGVTIPGITGPLRQSYLGYPIIETQAMPTSVGDLSNVAMIVFGDLRMGVYFGNRGGVAMDTSSEAHFQTNQTAIRANTYLDIVVHGLGDTSVAGPIVALIGE